MTPQVLIFWKRFLIDCSDFDHARTWRSFQAYYVHLFPCPKCLEPFCLDSERWSPWCWSDLLSSWSFCPTFQTSNLNHEAVPCLQHWHWTSSSFPSWVIVGDVLLGSTDCYIDDCLQVDLLSLGLWDQYWTPLWIHWLIWNLNSCQLLRKLGISKLLLVTLRFLSLSCMSLLSSSLVKVFSSILAFHLLLVEHPSW